MNNERKNFPQMEEEVLKFWRDNKIFEATISNREGAPDFVFYDGPPFATGLPHHGHILASTSKDLVGRYKTMRGFRVLRRWGWDCHGLPVENLIEKELEINGRKEIEAYGIDKFNKACQASVLKYDKEWEGTIERIGRFVDFKNSYMTMSNDFMESVWWGFKQLYDKNLVYHDTRISLYCPRCETPLSNTEIAMDNSYQLVTDPSVYVKMKIKDSKNENLLIWTTTPWTLPANVAVAVNPKIEYVKVDTGKEILILAKAMYETLLPDLGEAKIVKTLMGEELVGLSYEPVFNYFTPKKKAYVVVAGDFVTTEDGTGLVHIAPAFGEDDYRVGKENDLEIIETVDSQAKFIPEVLGWAGKFVWHTNKEIIKYLDAQGLVFKVLDIRHEYPFCYRCETKLIYKTQPAWFIKVSAIKDRMIELNEGINWIPDHLKHGRFGKGLAGAPEWNISRSRYWGNPIPVWINDQTDEVIVIGSIEELEKLSGAKVTDLHRPLIDDVQWTGEKGGTFKRVPEVFDCWLESGSMPWASVHYPFENKEYFEANYPAEFISEYINQTRGWFYTLHVLATGIFDKPSFLNVVTTGTIVAGDGKKMSKSKKNFTDPKELFDRLGVDSMRYYLMSSPLMNAENLSYKDEDQEEVFRKIIMLTWNVYTFFDTYRHLLTGTELLESPHILDRWILAKLNILTKEMTEHYDGYDITKGTRLLGDFINEFSTWYLRRSRDRFKDDENPKDQEYAINTTYNVLLTLAKLMAPVTPFIAEDLYQNLKGSKLSIHLEDWPTVDLERIKLDILTGMDSVRGLVERALAIRAQTGMKVRQALGVLYISMVSLDEEYLPLIADEVNVKEVKAQKELPKESETIIVNADESYKVALDISITDDLRKDGLAREIIRLINNYRKELLLTPADMVVVRYSSDSADIVEVMKTLNGEIAKSVRATSLEEGAENFDKVVVVNEVELRLQIVK